MEFVGGSFFFAFWATKVGPPSGPEIGHNQMSSGISGPCWLCLDLGPPDGPMIGCRPCAGLEFVSVAVVASHCNLPSAFSRHFCVFHIACTMLVNGRNNVAFWALLLFVLSSTKSTASRPTPPTRRMKPTAKLADSSSKPADPCEQVQEADSKADRRHNRSTPRRMVCAAGGKAGRPTEHPTIITGSHCLEQSVASREFQQLRGRKYEAKGRPGEVMSKCSAATAKVCRYASRRRCVGQ